MNKAIGQPLNRVDGRLKVSGGARYAYEMPVNGVVYGVLVQSAIAKGRVTNIDSSSALRAPGVLAVITHQNAPRLARPMRLPSGDSYPILQNPEIHFSGQNIAVVVADTLERAEHAAKLVRATYDAQKPIADMDAILGEAFDPPTGLTGGRPSKSMRGDVEGGWQNAVVRVEQTYVTPIYHHNAMEPHATIAQWDGDNLLCYNATQNVNGNRQALSSAFGISVDNVRVVNHFVGGGFGSKGMSWPHTVITALAAKVVGRPVKLALTREQMYFSNGHRPRTVQKVSLGADSQGKLVAIRHNTISHTSILDDFVEPTGLLTQMLYSCPNVEIVQRLVRLNVGTPTFTRAPGEASGSFALETAMDELAYAAKLDPLELRLRNYAERDEHEKKEFSSKSLRQCYEMGAEQFGWAKRNPQNSSMRDGRLLVGYGMATATYPANFRGSSARAAITSDGRVLIKTASHDLGTGTYTILAQIAADALAVSPERVRVEIGDTRLPEAPGAGGSTSAASVGSGVQAAAQVLRQKLVQMTLSDSESPLYGLKPPQVDVEDARVFAKDDRARGETYVQLMARHQERLIEAQADITERRSQKGQQGNSQGAQSGNAQAGNAKGDEGEKSFHGFGAQFMEVRVDPDLGTVRVVRALGVFANGTILNLKTARSQIIGGMTMGIGMALLEATHLDANFGRYTNANLAEYLVPVNADIPDIEVHFVDEKDEFVNPLGVKGVGEIGIVGAAAAVANAVFHATGKRVRELPITLDKLL